MGYVIQLPLNWWVKVKFCAAIQLAGCIICIVLPLDWLVELLCCHWIGGLCYSAAIELVG